ncbi:MAG TPA: c-type cytochrome biogenesis protein CcsB [Candidatus Baltobacteraceae bacterium]|jgi:cytochrome c-type biogenesis protein CcsB|nr:c-type cytochrome biogenesis protein CcsB [Candidatus Baltobacteraceae bacterium]
MQTAIGSGHMPLDEVLLVIAIGAYTIGALALIVYFFSREEWLAHLGIPLALAGCAAQFAQLAARFEITHVWPLLNLYGSLSLFSAVSVGIFIYFAFRYRLWFAGGFVLALAALFLAYGSTWNEGVMPPVPSLQSYWAKIHVPLVVSSYAAFMVAFVMAALFLVKYYFERGLEGNRFSVSRMMAVAGAENVRSTYDYQIAQMAMPDAGISSPAVVTKMDTPNIAQAAAQGNAAAAWMNAMPSLAQMDVLIYRIVAVGLPLLTLGIITGAMWAHESWGAYWQWDPKETAALFSWIVYAIYMHLHTRAQWRGVRSAWISLVGFLSIMFCYFGVNLWISGLHSYKV